MQSLLDAIRKPDPVRMVEVSGRADDDAYGTTRMQHSPILGHNIPQRHDLCADREDEPLVHMDAFRHGDTLELKPWVHRLALQGQHAEDALVDSPQWLVADEAFQGFNTQGELSQG
jgi:hypothetical protein